MNTSETYEQQVMTALVGTPDARHEFGAAIRDYQNRVATTETYYDALELAAIQATTDGVRGALKDHRFNLEAAKTSLHFIQNLPVGINVTVAVCKAVGDTYEQMATVPQDIHLVNQNLDKIMRYAYGLAFTGAAVATYSLEAIKQGRNPRKVRNFPFIARKMITFAGNDGTVANDFRNGIVTKEDDTGQLQMQPKHPILPKIKDRRCPVANTRSEGAKSRGALLTFMRTIGDVALENIYPQQFLIKP